MRAKLINEKFSEESDPIKDMGIGMPSFNTNVEAAKWLIKHSNYLNFEIKDSYEDKEIRKIIQKIRNWYSIADIYNDRDGEQEFWEELEKFLPLFSSTITAAEYALDNLLSITGFEYIEFDPGEEDTIHPIIISKLNSWYKKNKDLIGCEDEEDFWEIIEIDGKMFYA